MTISAPNSKGFCKKGEANVLSTANNILFDFDIAAQETISIICMVGLVGVSTQINFVFVLIKFFLVIFIFIYKCSFYC